MRTGKVKESQAGMSWDVGRESRWHGSSWQDIQQRGWLCKQEPGTWQHTNHRWQMSTCQSPAWQAPSTGHAHVMFSSDKALLYAAFLSTCPRWRVKAVFLLATNKIPFPLQNIWDWLQMSSELEARDCHVSILQQVVINQGWSCPAHWRTAGNDWRVFGVSQVETEVLMTMWCAKVRPEMLLNVLQHMGWSTHNRDWCLPAPTWDTCMAVPLGCLSHWQYK